MGEACRFWAGLQTMASCSVCPRFFTSGCSSLRTVLCYHLLAHVGLHVKVLLSLEHKGQADKALQPRPAMP